MGKVATIYWIHSTNPICKNESHSLQHSILKKLIHKTPIINRENGKPFLTNANLEFSVSHTQNTWVMAVSEAPIGIDIESIHRTIPETVLNRGQTNALPLSHSPIKNVLTWTQFEANAKLTGSGIRFPIPAEVPGHLKSFVWQSLMVTVASSDPLSDVYVAQYPYPQNGYEWCYETWQSIQPFALKWEQNSTTPEPTLDDLTNAHDPVSLHHEASKY